MNAPGPPAVLCDQRVVQLRGARKHLRVVFTYDVPIGGGVAGGVAAVVIAASVRCCMTGHPQDAGQVGSKQGNRHPAAMNRHCALAVVALLAVQPANLQARTWTSSDGRQIEAEFVSATDSAVTIRKAGRDFTLALDKLSAEDRTFVAGQLAAAKKFDLASLGDKAGFFKGEWVKADHDGLPYQIFAPAKVEKDRPLPLVVFLHGIGERGNDGARQLNGLPRSFAADANFSVRPCIIIAPQCPADGFWSGPTAERVIDLIEELAEDLPVDEDRIYLGGFSMGGYGTWTILAAKPKLFACGFPIAGGADPSIAGTIKKIPVWNFHGEADPTVKVEESRKIVEALKKQKGDITYTELPGEGHGIAGKVLADAKLHRWIFEQKRE